jgi:primosomal protein N'
MEYYYEVIIEKKVPFTVLTYKSDIQLIVGEIVKVPLRKKIIYGVVSSTILSPSHQDISRTKSIDSTLGVKINSNWLSFCEIFAYNTFNTPHVVLATILNHVKSLPKKDISEIIQVQKNTISELKNSESNNIGFYRTKEYSLRIKNIIRRLISESEKNKTYKKVLIICPEVSIINQIFKTLADMYLANESIVLLKYISDKSRISNDSVKKLLTSQNDKNYIIVGSRTSLFIPQEGIDEIIVIDENNTLYIQEQNSFYYDLRDAAFVLSKVFLCNLTFISTVPSVRFLEFYSSEENDVDMTNSPTFTQKPLKMQIFKRESFDTFEELFSTQILSELGFEQQEQ